MKVSTLTSTQEPPFSQGELTHATHGAVRIQFKTKCVISVINFNNYCNLKKNYENEDVGVT